MNRFIEETLCKYTVFYFRFQEQIFDLETTLEITRKSSVFRKEKKKREWNREFNSFVLFISSSTTATQIVIKYKSIDSSKLEYHHRSKSI